MPRFFVDEVFGGKIFITGQDAKHITGSLRMKEGDKVIVCDKNEVEHYCKIVALGDKVELEVSLSSVCENEPDVKLTLYQAMPKSDKLEFIIQKAVELGVSEIVPIMTSRCISRPDDRSMAKKSIRYNKIAEQAAKQCGRGIIPAVRPMMSFDAAAAMAAKDDCAMIFYELGGEKIGDIIPGGAKSISVIVGSEGGFSEQEIKIAERNKIVPASLGKRILRCETAPVAALSIIMYQTGNMQ